MSVSNTPLPHGHQPPRSGGTGAEPRGQDAAFEELVRNHRGGLERLARRLARDAEDAEDLLQETLVDAYRAFHRFRPDSYFYAWVARIMTNNHLDRARRKQRVVVSLDHSDVEPEVEHAELRDESTNPEVLLLHRQMDAPLESALDALQPCQRRTVELCDLEGATYEEAAAATDCPIGTIRSRLHRAHRAIRSFLERLHAEPEPPLPIERASSRRAFLRMGTAAAAGAAFGTLAAVEGRAEGEPVRVLVWHEGAVHPEVTALVEALSAERELQVTLASADAPELGLGDSALRHADVLVWAGRAHHDRVPDDRVAAILRRVRDGGLGFIGLHGAELSRPLQALVGSELGVPGEEPPASGAVEGPLAVRVTAPRHPIAQGVGPFTLPRAVVSDTRPAVRQPEVVVFDGAMPGTERRTWQGMVWKIGRGRVFAFQPGHPTEAVAGQEHVRRILRNAVRWSAARDPRTAA